MKVELLAHYTANNFPLPAYSVDESLNFFILRLLLLLPTFLWPTS
jgi:hypothetical protein